MPKRILVPLDRSETALAVLPLVGALARGSGATVRLLRVAPVPKNVVSEDGRVIAYADQEMERVEREGLEYLKGAQAQLDGVPVESVVRFGEPAEEIVREADAFGADLIVVARSRRGWLRGLLGGIAARVFWRSEAPVVVLGAR